jgi:hypothetical protein
MHGVAPQMCGRVACPLLGRGAGGRSPGFLYRPCSIFQRLKRALTCVRVHVPAVGCLPVSDLIGLDLPLNFHPATVRVSEFLKRSPKLGQPVLEFSGESAVC